MRLLPCITCDSEEQSVFQVLVHMKCWAYVIQEESAQAGDFYDSKWTARPQMGKVHMKKVLGHMFDTISCFS